MAYLFIFGYSFIMFKNKFKDASNFKNFNFIFCLNKIWALF